jgi:hypothetical protein
MNKLSIALLMAVSLSSFSCKKKKAGDTAGSAPASSESTPTAGGGGGGTGMADCDAYVAATDAYMKCDKVPQEGRDAAKQTIDSMKAGWADMAKMPDAAKKQTNDACKGALDAFKKGAEAAGCKL